MRLILFYFFIFIIVNAEIINYEYDVCVVGAGPGGTQLGYFMQTDLLNYVIIEKNEISGSWFKKFPRRGTLISINKKYTGSDDNEFNLRTDWNSLLSDDYSFLATDHVDGFYPNASQVSDYIDRFSKRYHLNVHYGTEVFLIEKNIHNTSKWIVNSRSKSQTIIYDCNYLIISTGTSAPYIPVIEGIEYTVGYEEMDLNTSIYINKEVLILGKGNSAFEISDLLTPFTSKVHMVSSDPPKMAHQTHYVGDVRIIHSKLIDHYQLKIMDALFDKPIESLEIKPCVRLGDQYFTDLNFLHDQESERKFCILLDGRMTENHYDKILRCLGFTFDNSIFGERVVPEMKGKFPVVDHLYQSSNVENLYFAGSAMHYRDYGKTSGGFVHGFRYIIRSVYKIWKEKWFGVSSPNSEEDIRTLITNMLGRLSNTSAIYHMFGFMGDVYEISDKTFIHHKEVLVDWLPDHFHGLNKKNYILMTIEYGKNFQGCDVMSKDRVQGNSPEEAHMSNFLHPIFRHFKNGVLQSEHHLMENIYNNWSTQEQYVSPLNRWLRASVEIPPQFAPR